MTPKNFKNRFVAQKDSRKNSVTIYKIEIDPLEGALEPLKGSERWRDGKASMCDDVTIPANQGFICSIITLLKRE